MREGGCALDKIHTQHTSKCLSQLCLHLRHRSFMDLALAARTHAVAYTRTHHEFKGDVDEQSRWLSACACLSNT